MYILEEVEFLVEFGRGAWDWNEIECVIKT
jgi:hypothetical protein